MKILELQDISFQYGEKDVLTDIHLSIQKGEQTSLLGLSGSGKTTLLRLCAGFEKPRTGEIRLRDQVVASEKNFVKCKDRKIGFVFQDYALFPHLNIRDNINYGCSAREHQEKARELTQLLKLEEHLAKYPEQLSGGERQKVALARTLCLEPDFVFLDEPFSSIDQQQTRDLVKELRRLFQELGVSSLMVTHSQYEAIDFSDRVFVLDHGKLLQEGSPRALYESPQSEFVADFFGIANWVKGVREAEGMQTEFGFLPLQNKLQKTACKVLVRPEDLQLQDKGKGVTCLTLSQAYRFNRYLVDVRTPKGQVLTVDSSRPWDPGSSCQLQLKVMDSLAVF